MRTFGLAVVNALWRVAVARRRVVVQIVSSVELRRVRDLDVMSLFFIVAVENAAVRCEVFLHLFQSMFVLKRSIKI